MELPARAEAEQSGRDIADTERWPIRLHGRRHCTETKFAAGMNPQTLADQLGYAIASMILVANTATTDARAQAAAQSFQAGLGLSMSVVGSF